MRYGRLIMFCDYGLDDAIATLHILGNADMFERIDIVPIGGNVRERIAFRNAHTLLAHAHPDKNKARIIDTGRIVQCAEDIPDVHGGDGIGDVLEPMMSELDVIDFTAFAAEINASKNPERDCVLSLGPCTLPVMLGYTPETTVLMGGTTREQPNFGAYEFNEGCDITAFRAFAKKASSVATLDTCHDEGFDFDNYKTNDELANTLIARYVKMCRLRSAPVAIYDLVAAFAVTNPEMFERVPIVRPDGVTYNELKRSRSK